MNLPYFNKAYSLFMVVILAETKNASQKDLNNPQETSRYLIKKDWNAALEKAKKEWENGKRKTTKAQKKKVAKKAKKIAKKIAKKAIRKIK